MNPPSIKTSSNKRKYVRHQCLVPVDGKNGTVFSGSQTVDFSKNGMGFISSSAIPLNEKIAIEIELESQGPSVLVIAQVRWVRQIEGSSHYRFGLRFEDVLDGSRNRMASYFRT